jgi:hypothetical protein
VLAGTPLYTPMDGMSECCKRAKSKETSPKAEASRLCCAMNCSQSVPTSSGGSTNPTPASFTITRSVADQIAALFTKEKTAPIALSFNSREIFPRYSQPSYIQHHAFLI